MKFRKPALVSATLSILFLGIYGFTNWLSAQRPDVGMFYFEWERHIPFVPWLIIPYMSIDLFFIASPFLCKTEAELRAFARRIAFCIFVAGACFLLFPLRFAFERPHVDGWLGVIFNNFRNFDQPYNLLPSLHIALRTILAATYVRHTKGAWRALNHIWFSLIGFSTLFTYQHHILDVVGGFILAAYAFYFFSETPARLTLIPNRRIGLFYLIGFAALALATTVLPLYGLLLLWPAIAFLIVGLAYFRLGPGIYRKTNGDLPLAVKIVLGPVLVGQRLSLLYYKRQCKAWDAVLPNLWIGRKLSAAEADAAVAAGVRSVLDVTAEFSEAAPFRALHYLNMPILDLTAPSVAQLHTAAEFITRASGTGIVYVHCKIGYSRSAGAIAAYLLISGIESTIESAVTRLRKVRPSIVIRPEIIAVLNELERSLRTEKVTV